MAQNSAGHADAWSRDFGTYDEHLCKQDVYVELCGVALTQQEHKKSRWFNPAIDALEGDDALQLTGIVIGAAELLTVAVWQVLVLVQLKKQAANYSAMATVPDGGEKSEPLSDG